MGMPSIKIIQRYVRHDLARPTRDVAGRPRCGQQRRNRWRNVVQSVCRRCRYASSLVGYMGVYRSQRGRIVPGRGFAILLGVWLWGACAMAEDGLISVSSGFGPKETTDRLEAEIKARGVTVFARGVP